MPYPYGMQNSPVVGNGLGGLPRRAVAAGAAVAARTRYDLLHFPSFTTPSIPSSPQNMSLPILMNGRGLQYFTNSTPTVFRNTFDYSVAGVSNNTSTTISGSTITQLPTTSTFNANRNFVWSHQVSSTQTLFKYTGLRPFLVTWDGINDSSFVHPTAPADIVISNTSDAFLLPNGNLAVFGNASSNGNLYYLVEYTPTLTFVRSLYLGATSGLIGGTLFQAAVRKTSYGYIVGIQHVADGTGAYCFAATLNSTCTTVIQTRTSKIQMSSPNSSNQQSVICGEDGVIFASWGNIGTIFGSVNMPVSSSGEISSVAANQYYGAESITASMTYGVNSFVGVIPGGMGCNKFATTTSPSLFVGGNSDYKSAPFSSHHSASGQRTANYVDIDIRPIININPVESSSTIYSAHVESTVNGSYFYAATDRVGINMAADDDGFVWLNYRGNFQSNAMFRRVYR